MSLNQNDPRLRAALSAYQQGAFDEAARHFIPLVEENPKNAQLLHALGVVETGRTHFEAAIGYLQRAVAIEPRNPHILTALALAEMNVGQLEDARTQLEALISLHPEMAEAHKNLGVVHLESGNAAAARASLERALDLQPAFPDALIRLAGLCEREHKYDDALALASRAVELAPLNPAANITLARIEMRRGAPDKAVERLEKRLKTPPLSEHDAAIINNLLGQAQHRLGNYDQAFSAYEAANDVLHAHYHRQIEATNSGSSPEFIERLTRFFEVEDVSSWTEAPEPERPAPVFLVGFPRSGTTLLEQILNAHSGVRTLDEPKTLSGLRDELLAPPGALEKLRAMAPERINEYRRRYRELALRELGDASFSGVLVDKLPLNTVHLGLIYRLFPEARIIFALRDPRDSILSCFQQRFGMNVAMYQFLKLKTAVEYYDAVMTLGQIFLSRLPLAHHVIRYEDVVSDMQTTVEGLISFLGLAWEDDILQYKERARDRWISTPSFEHVVKPLYDSSIGKWRNYRRHLEPVLPTLDPWVRRFGYEPD